MVQSLLAEVGADLPIQPGERDGQFPNGYLWHLEMHHASEGVTSVEIEYLSSWLKVLKDDKRAISMRRPMRRAVDFLHDFQKPVAATEDAA
jgi:antirestriction protein ArdC